MTALGQTASPRRAELRGHAAGVWVCSFFALAWVGWGLSRSDLAVHIPTLVVTGTLCVAIALGGFRLFRVGGALPAGPRSQAERRIGRQFGTVVAVEWAALAAVAAVLGAAGHPQWIAAAMCAGVGVHFLPLARLFGIRGYSVTAGVLVALAVATVLAVAVAGAPVALCYQIPGFGAALTLWLTAVHLLRRAGARWLPAGIVGYVARHGNRSPGEAQR